MKCDVCGTKIPIGSNECPKCGYKYGKSSVNTYDASGQTHEHIQTVQVKDIAHRVYKPITKKPSSKKSSSKKKTSAITTVILTMIIICVVITLAIPAMLFYFLDDDISWEVPNELSMVERVEEGYDEDGTCALALAEEDILMQLFDDELNMENIDFDEYVDTFQSETYATITFYGTKNECDYCITATFEAGALTKKNITLTWDQEKSMRDQKNQWCFDRATFDVMSEYMDMNIYQVIDENRLSMSKDADSARYVYSDYSDIDIYLSEAVVDYYHYYCSLGQYY